VLSEGLRTAGYGILEAFILSSSEEVKATLSGYGILYFEISE
jgi:hypothetical protein